VQGIALFLTCSQDDATGDGTTSNVLIIGELLKQADLYITEGLHPSIVTEGFDIAKEQALKVANYIVFPVACYKGKQNSKASLITALQFGSCDVFLISSR